MHNWANVNSFTAQKGIFFILGLFLFKVNGSIANKILYFY